jgi:hypothetical protein
LNVSQVETTYDTELKDPEPDLSQVLAVPIINNHLPKTNRADVEVGPSAVVPPPGRTRSPDLVPAILGRDTQNSSGIKPAATLFVLLL